MPGILLPLLPAHMRVMRVPSILLPLLPPHVRVLHVHMPSCVHMLHVAPMLVPPLAPNMPAMFHMLKATLLLLLVPRSVLRCCRTLLMTQGVQQQGKQARQVRVIQGALIRASSRQ